MDEVVQKDEWDENEGYKGGIEEGTDAAVVMSVERVLREIAGDEW